MKKLNQRGQFTYVMLFILIFVVLLFTFAILIPIMEALIIGFAAGTTSIQPTIDAQVALIHDTNLQSDINGAVTAQYNMQATTVQLFTTLVTYAGIITIVVLFFAWLLIGRRNVESGGLG